MGNCPPDEIALKSFFLGPQSENGRWFRQQIETILNHHLSWRENRFPSDGRAISEEDQSTPEFIHQRNFIESEVRQLLAQFEAETPKFTPRYIGHMVSETSLPALLGHIVCLLHNPNNASLEVSRVGSRLERQAIEMLLQMVGFNPREGCGHFTSGGTLANFEAMWRARYQLDHSLSLALLLKESGRTSADLFSLAHMGRTEFASKVAAMGIPEDRLKSCSAVLTNPLEIMRRLDRAFALSYCGPVILVPGNKHYSWQKGTSLIGLGADAFRSVALDVEGRLDVEDLQKQIEWARAEQRPILMVVSVAGTTEMGELDPINKVQDLLDFYRKEHALHLWHHVDAAYGGYFRTVKSELSEASLAALAALPRVDSITLDPHKLGYVPYACGAILLPSEAHNAVSSFAAPYLNAERQGIWSSTLEGSRPASGAVATYLSSLTLALNPNGHGKILEKGIQARKRLQKLFADRLPQTRSVDPLDTNIFCFALAKKNEPLSQRNQRTLRLYEKLAEGPNFAVTKTHLSVASYRKLIERFLLPDASSLDAPELTLIRAVLMNPFITSRETKTDFLEKFTGEVAAMID